MFLTNVTSFSARFAQRYGVVDERVQLGVDSVEGQRKLGRQGRRRVLKGCQRRAKDARFQASHQSGDFPAVRGQKVAMGAGWAVDETFQPQAPQIVRHLGRRVGGRLDSQQVGHMTAQIAVAEALDQVREQAQRHSQSHHPRIAKLQPRAL